MKSILNFTNLLCKLTDSFDISRRKTCGSCQSTTGKYVSIKAPGMGKGQYDPTNILYVCIFIWKFSNSTGRNVLGRWVEDFGLVLFGGKEAEEWCHCSLQLLEAGKRRGDLLSLGSSAGTCGNGSKLSQGRFTLDISLSRRWSKPEQTFSGRCWCPSPVSVQEAFWTMPLTRCFNWISPEWVRQLG